MMPYSVIKCLISGDRTLGELIFPAIHKNHGGLIKGQHQTKRMRKLARKGKRVIRSLQCLIRQDLRLRAKTSMLGR